MSELELLRRGDQHGVKRLKLKERLTRFPLEIVSLATSLEILDLSGNPLCSLPEAFASLHKLKIAFFSDCEFQVFPGVLGQCPALEMVAFKNNGMQRIPKGSLPPQLRWLILTNNKIDSLPDDIGRCTRLQKCMLAGNHLSTLPDDMIHCQKLGLLRLSANRIMHLPPWLFEMPELAFLAFAGNPCAPAREDNPVLDDVAWHELEVTKLLGEGASGIISQGLWKKGVAEEVAVKLFKGDVTSDGLPADEMSACITAGSHPNLIDPIGKIHGHPDKRGLVLQLIPPTYTNLGLPPTLITCTRDSFEPGLKFGVKKASAICLGIARAAKHLHERGIAHGDLYAHNILIEDSGHALLGDFGAATIYGQTLGIEKKLERLEVLAFGHLLEDMLGLVSHVAHDEAVAMRNMMGVHTLCTQRDVSRRPGFGEIVSRLEWSI